VSEGLGETVVASVLQTGCHRWRAGDGARLRAPGSVLGVRARSTSDDASATMRNRPSAMPALSRCRSVG